MDKVAKRYSPCSVVIDVNSPCKAGLLAGTLRAGTAAPEVSVRVPLTAPLLGPWANVAARKKPQMHGKINETRMVSRLHQLTWLSAAPLVSRPAQTVSAIMWITERRCQSEKLAVAAPVARLRGDCLRESYRSY